MAAPFAERGDSARSGPWLGLESYSERDADRFYGREAETAELLRRVRREVLTIVFGPSGIGKTSLLRAGLFARLAEQDHLPIYIRPSYKEGSPPVAEQALAVIRHTLESRKVEEDLGGKPAATLWEYLHSAELWDRNNRLLTPVLFFDQFEEIFTVGRGTPAAETFLIDLAAIVENYLPPEVCHAFEVRGEKLPEAYRRQNYKVVITLREDFVHKLDDLRKRMPSIMQNRYPLAQLNGTQAFEAVVKPGAGIVTGQVALHIVRFVAASSKQAEQSGEAATDLADLWVDPALLSVVCQQLYVRARKAGQATISTEAVEAARTDILDSFYERSFEGLPPEARVFVEDRLLTQSGFRNTAPLEDANRAGLNADVVTALVDRRLIRMEQRLGITHLELTHDLLAKVVERSRATRQERERRIAAEMARERQSRSLKRVRLAFLVCLVFSGLALFSWWRASQSEKKARHAEQRAVEAEARVALAASHVALENVNKQLEIAKSQGNTQDYAKYSQQLKGVQQQLSEWSSKARAAATSAGQVSISIQPQNAARSLEATLRPETALSGSKIDSAKFMTGYATAIRPLSDRQTQALGDVLNQLNDDRAIPDVRWAAYLLATIQWESGQTWTPLTQSGPASSFARYEPGSNLGAVLGNTEAGDGYRYRGRGYVFLTGKGNYARFGRLAGLGDQLVTNPDLAMDPKVAYRLISQGMVKGWFSENRKLGNFISGDSADYVNARRIINGLDHAEGIAQAAAKIDQVLTSSLVSR